MHRTLGYFTVYSSQGYCVYSVLWFYTLQLTLENCSTVREATGPASAQPPIGGRKFRGVARRLRAGERRQAVRTRHAHAEQWKGGRGSGGACGCERNVELNYSQTFTEPCSRLSDGAVSICTSWKA